MLFVFFRSSNLVTPFGLCPFYLVWKQTLPFVSIFFYKKRIANKQGHSRSSEPKNAALALSELAGHAVDERGVVAAHGVELCALGVGHGPRMSREAGVFQGVSAAVEGELAPCRKSILRTAAR